MRAGTRPDYLLGPLKWNSAISGEGLVLGEPEALLSHSAEREAGRGRNTNAHSLTHSFGAIQSLAHTLSLSLSHGRERESENQ